MFSVSLLKSLHIFILCGKQIMHAIEDLGLGLL